MGWTNRATIIPPDTARKGCNWKNKILIEFVTRAFPCCFDGKILYPNQSNFVPLVIPSLGPLDLVAMQSLDHSRKYEITTNIIVVYFTHWSRKINNMFIIDRNVTAFAQWLNVKKSFLNWSGEKSSWPFKFLKLSRLDKSRTVKFCDKTGVDFLYFDPNYEW